MGWGGKGATTRRNVTQGVTSPLKTPAQLYCKGSPIPNTSPNRIPTATNCPSTAFTVPCNRPTAALELPPQPASPSSKPILPSSASLPPPPCAPPCVHRPHSSPPPPHTHTLAHLQAAFRRQQRWDNCTFPAAYSFRCGALRVAAFRALKSGLSRTSIGDAHVAFPAALLPGPLRAVAGATVDVCLTAVPPRGPLVTDTVSVTLLDPATAREVPVEALPEPVTITFPLPRPLPRQPVAQWYRCVYDAGTAWDTAGVWLTADARAVRCHTTHLSTFAVLPVVRVLRVQVLLVPCVPRAQCAVLSVRQPKFEGPWPCCGSDRAKSVRE